MQTLTTAKNRQIPALAMGIGLLLLAFLLNYNSSGVIRDGGDDEGSGIGGTGIIRLPGSESGLGGTGLRPFVGMQLEAQSDQLTATTEVDVFYNPEQRDQAIASNLDLVIPDTREITESPLPSPAQVASVSQFTRDSSAIEITEQIQRDLDSNALSFMQLREAVSNTTATAVTQAAAIAQESLENSEPLDSEFIAESKIEHPVAELKDEVSWSALASLLQQQSEQNADSSTVSDASFNDDATRLARPERLLRPELPPVQRVRPIQRAAILPPRVRPLNL